MAAARRCQDVMVFPPASGGSALGHAAVCGQLTGSVEMLIEAAAPKDSTAYPGAILRSPKASGKVVAGPKPPPGGLVSTVSPVVLSTQLATNVPAASATTWGLVVASPGADSRAGVLQAPPAGRAEVYATEMKLGLDPDSCPKMARASPAPSMATSMRPSPE